MKFIATAKGFVKEARTFFNKEEMKSEIIISYTDNLRDARQFSKKAQAQKCMFKYEIEGFIYSPFEYDDNSQKWYEVKPSPFYDATPIEKVAFAPQEKWHTSYSDLNFLKGEEHPREKYFTYEEAVALAKEKNLELIKLLTEKVQ